MSINDDTDTLGPGGDAPAPRPQWTCLRCGHEWTGVDAAHPPARCVRCRSNYWNREPYRQHARRPGDPPLASWSRPKPPRRRRLPAFPPVAVPQVSKMTVHRPLDLASPRGLPPPPQLDDVYERNLVEVVFPSAPMPPPQFDAPAPESFMRPRDEADEPVDIREVPGVVITEVMSGEEAARMYPELVDPRTMELVDNVIAAIVPAEPAAGAEPPEPAPDLAAEAGLREQEYLEHDETVPEETT